MPHTTARSLAKLRASLTGEPLAFAHSSIGRDGELFDAAISIQTAFRAHLALHLFNAWWLNPLDLLLSGEEVVPSPQYNELIWFSENPARLATMLIETKMPWRHVLSDPVFGGIACMDVVTGGTLRILQLDAPAAVSEYEDGFVSERTRCYQPHGPHSFSDDATKLLSALTTRWALDTSSASSREDSDSTHFAPTGQRKGPRRAWRISLEGQTDNWTLAWDGGPRAQTFVHALTGPAVGLPGAWVDGGPELPSIRFGTACLRLERTASKFR